MKSESSPQFDKNPSEETPKPKKSTSVEKWIKRVEEQEMLGSGFEKRVFIHPDDPQKVVAVFHRDKPIGDIKKRFFVNKILHILYPNNIPDIRLAAPRVLVLDRVTGKQAGKLRHGFSKRRIESQLGKVGAYVDSAHVNFMISKNGKVFYIDGFGGNFLKLHRIKLLKAINKLSPQKREKALSYLGRLDALKKSQDRE